MTTVWQPASPPAGWYPDPTDNRALCWWDGTQWYVHTKHFPAQQAGTGQFTPRPLAVPMSISLSLM
jgi:hypothetical protein